MNTSKILNLLLALSLLVLVLKLTFFAPVVKETAVQDPRQMILENIHQRKSVRSFTNEPVSKQQLDTLVRAGMAAPSARNMQPWFFVVVDEKPLLEKLSQISRGSAPLSKAAAAIVVCGNMEEAFEGEDRANWIQDCSAATENILLAVEAIDLGAVWIGVHPRAEREAQVASILNLPETIVPLNVIAIGHPDGEFQPKDKWDMSKVRLQNYDGPYIIN